MDSPNIVVREENLTPFVLTYSEDIIDLQTDPDIPLAGQVNLVGPKGDTGPQLKGISVFCSGRPVSSEIVGGGLAPYDFVINPANSLAKAKVAPTSSTTFTIFNGNTQIGSIVFEQNVLEGVVTISETNIATGDYVTFQAPVNADSTLADIGIIIRE